jgi:uncharacterized protein YbcI
MTGEQTKHQVNMAAVSRAMVALHKEQFGRGPTGARSYFGGGNVLTVVLDDALLPAEVRMVELGEANRVSETRVAYQSATREKFAAAVEQILYRKVASFASAVDPATGVVFEVFTFEPEDGGEQAADGRVAAAGSP